ncbi:TPA: His-Xaa-Ser system radical SAM maturase HxsB, partial [Escherichia coli]
MELMPFNFDRLPNGQVFISNLAGFHHFIGEQDLIDLSDERTNSEQSNVLESKLFITSESS